VWGFTRRLFPSSKSTLIPPPTAAERPAEPLPFEPSVHQQPWINSEIEGQNGVVALVTKTSYPLAFDIDVWQREAAVGTADLSETDLFLEGIDKVELTVVLDSDKFVILSAEQTLLVRLTGRSRRRASPSGPDTTPLKAQSEHLRGPQLHPDNGRGGKHPEGPSSPFETSPGPKNGDIPPRGCPTRHFQGVEAGHCPSVSSFERWRCARHGMRTVRGRIYAAHLTACRGIIKQLEQIEIDAFPHCVRSSQLERLLLP
jgi:hypothetical protein